MANQSIWDVSKPQITILWLDDQRDPQVYLTKSFKQVEKGVASGAAARTYEFYNGVIRQNYNPNFIWVKNIREFQNYILNSGMPDLISFDRDLTNKRVHEDYNGEDCAQWLLQYCQENNQSLPKYYVHSANPNGRINIPNILGQRPVQESRIVKNKRLIRLTESDLNKIVRKVLMEIYKR